jgi:hypothetical protein
MLVMFAGCLFVGETAQAAKKQPAAYLMQKDFGKKHESVYVLLEQQEPSLAAAFLQVTEWMTSRNRATKAEKKEMGAFLSQVNKSSLRKDDKKTVRSFIHRVTGKWSGGKIAGVAIGSFFAVYVVLGVAFIGTLIQKARQAQNATFGYDNDLRRHLLGSGSGAQHRAARRTADEVGRGGRGGRGGSNVPTVWAGLRPFPLHLVSQTVASGRSSEVSTFASAGAVDRGSVDLSTPAEKPGFIALVTHFGPARTNMLLNQRDFTPSQDAVYYKKSRYINSFLLQNPSLLSEIGALRMLTLSGDPYIFWQSIDSSSDIHIHKVFRDDSRSLQGFDPVSLADFHSLMGTKRCLEVGAVFGNDKIRSLYDEAQAQAASSADATGSVGADSVVASRVDDSEQIGFVRTLSGNSRLLTTRNFSDYEFLPRSIIAYNSLYSFLLTKPELVERIQILRSFVLKGQFYVFVILDDASSPIQVYKQDGSESRLHDFKQLLIQEGVAHQLHVVLGNDKIRSLFEDAQAYVASADNTTVPAVAGAGGASAVAVSGGVSGSACPSVFFRYLNNTVELSPSTFAQGTALGVPELVASHTQYQRVIEFLQSNKGLHNSLEGVAVVVRDGTPKVLYSNGIQWFIDAAEHQLHTATDTLQVVCGLFGKDAVQKFIIEHVNVVV